MLKYEWDEGLLVWIWVCFSRGVLSFLIIVWGYGGLEDCVWRVFWWCLLIGRRVNSGVWKGFVLIEV